MKNMINCGCAALATAALLVACTAPPAPVAPETAGADEAAPKTEITVSTPSKGNEPRRVRKTGVSPARNPATRADTLTTPDSAPATSGTQVWGNVTSADGRPVSGATISLHGPRGLLSAATEEPLVLSQTGEDGTYDISTDHEKVSFISAKGQFPEVFVPLISRARKSTPLNLHKFQRNIMIPQPHAVAGKVLDESKQPMAGVTVRLQPDYSSKMEILPAALEMKTTAAGEFLFPHVAAGTYAAGVQSPDYAPVISDLDVPTSHPLMLQFGLRGGTVTGRVVQQKDGSAVSGLEIMCVPESSALLAGLETRTQVSSSDGTFTFDHISSSPKKLMLRPTPNSRLGLTAPFPAGINLDEGETTEVVLFVYAGHTLSGKLFDKATSGPVAGAAVKIIGPDKLETVSDRDGQYEIENIFLNEGAGLRIAADGNGYVTDSENGYSSNLDVVVTHEDLKVRKDIPMVRLVKLRGKVVTQDEIPISRGKAAFVSAMPSNLRRESTPLQIGGAFEVEALPDSKGIVQVASEGFSPGESNFQQLSNQDVEGLKIVLNTAAMVEGKVLLPDGQPANAAAVVRRITTGEFRGRAPLTPAMNLSRFCGQL